MDDSAPVSAPVQLDRAWTRTFPGALDQVRAARRALAPFLAGHKHAHDVALCLAELGANAVLHSRTSEPGGHFTVRADINPARVYVEVQDQGGPWNASSVPEDSSGRGLLIVSQLATAWGVAGDDKGRTVWFELTCI